MRTLCGGREEGRQGGVKRLVWRATRVPFRTGLYEHQPASKVGLLKEYLGMNRLTVALTVPSFVCLFVWIVRSLRVVCSRLVLWINRVQRNVIAHCIFLSSLVYQLHVILNSCVTLGHLVQRSVVPSTLYILCNLKYSNRLTELLLITTLFSFFHVTHCSRVLRQ